MPHKNFSNPNQTLGQPTSEHELACKHEKWNGQQTETLRAGNNIGSMPTTSNTAITLSAMAKANGTPSSTNAVKPTVRIQAVVDIEVLLQ